MTTLADIAELVRAPAALSVPGDALTGATATGALGPRTAGLCAASVCLYWAGMAANDWADRDLDAKERPERPIPSGRVTPGTALGIAAGLTAGGVVLAGLTGGRRALAVAVPLAGAVWAYDISAKNTPAGPAAMAVCRGLDVLLGASADRLRPALLPALTVAAHTYTVTALSRREVDGGSPLLPAATLAGTVAVTSAATLLPPRPARWRRLLPGALAGWYGARYGTAQLRAISEPTAASIRGAVASGITTLPALQGALIAQEGAPLTGAAVAAAVPAGQYLAKRLSPT
ncbi:MAG TPA: UbiA family prenyltransferase [Streptosporangiaceae bacterium]|nr:UbiA family prenyltransferase [Streptosporangiaceae bacterium]